jgi:hypothetical protein
MLRFVAILALAWAFGLPVFAQAPLTKQQKIERIIDATNPGSAADAVVTQVRGMLEQLQPNPSAQQKKKRSEALDKIAKLSFDRVLKIRPQLIRAYDETFNDEEIDGMLAFYTSPAGRAAMQKMPAINQRLSALMQAEMDAAGKEIDKIAQETLK